MVQKLKLNKSGFTIIEVMIVLAIAGLIMLIVFLAVPALQRSQRNNSRNSDASRLAATVTECLANRNGVVANCSSVANVNPGQLSRLDTYSFGAAAYSLTDGRVSYGNQCNAAGDTAAAGGGTRAFAVTFQLETSGGTVNRCIAS